MAGVPDKLCTLCLSYEFCIEDDTCVCFFSCRLFMSWDSILTMLYERVAAMS